MVAILKSPSYPTLEKVAEALEVPMWQLFASPVEVQEDNNTIICPHCGGKIHFDKKNNPHTVETMQGKYQISKTCTKIVI